MAVCKAALECALRSSQVLHIANTSQVCGAQQLYPDTSQKLLVLYAQVYVAYTEVVNFKKALADLLGLSNDCSVGACLQRIRHLLDR